MENFQVKNLERGHLTLFGEVDDEKVCTLIEQLAYLEGRRSVREITLWINSAGGLLQPAFGLADLMEVLSKPIRTIGLGTVESAATVILMSGTRGRRLATRNASVMIHEYSWSNSGSVTEMEGRMTEIKNTARKQVAHLVKCTGRTEVEVRGLLRHQETWLTPEECRDWGLIDGILDFNPVRIPGGGRGKAARRAPASPKRSRSGNPARPTTRPAPGRKPGPRRRA